MARQQILNKQQAMAKTQLWLNIKILYGFLPYTLHSDMQFSHCLLICVTLVADKGYAYAD